MVTAFRLAGMRDLLARYVEKRSKTLKPMLKKRSKHAQSMLKTASEPTQTRRKKPS